MAIWVKNIIKEFSYFMYLVCLPFSLMTAWSRQGLSQVCAKVCMKPNSQMNKHFNGRNKILKMKLKGLNMVNVRMLLFFFLNDSKTFHCLFPGSY